MAAYRVIVPQERFRLVQFKQEGLVGVAVINETLREFEPKIVFGWHLSVLMRFEDLAANGMPSPAEQSRVEPFEQLLDMTFKGDELDKPNALILARITWNATRELIYRVYDPEPIHGQLQQLIDAAAHPRPFDYRIDPDPQWQLAQWHMNAGL